MRNTISAAVIAAGIALAASACSSSFSSNGSTQAPVASSAAAQPIVIGPAAAADSVTVKVAVTVPLLPSVTETLEIDALGGGWSLSAIEPV